MKLKPAKKWASWLIPVALLGLVCLYFGRIYWQRRLNDSLIAAIRKNDAAVVKSLLKSGADANARERVDNGYSWWDTLRYFLRNRRLPEVNREPALAVAMDSMDPRASAVLCALVAGGARLNVRNSSGYGILSCAIYDRDIALVKMALDHGANPTEVNSTGDCALTDAIVLGESNIASLLVDRGADPNERDQVGRGGGRWKFDREPALCCAMGVTGENGPDAALIKDLLAHGANVNAADDHGHTALMWAVSEGGACDVLIRLLLGKGATVSLRDKSGATPLEMAYARQRGFLKASGHGRSRAFAGLTPHIPTSPDYSEDDATDVIRLLKQAGAKK